MLSLPVALFAQQEKVKNQPYVDNKLFHLGFHVGLHAQDMILTHSGNPLLFSRLQCRRNWRHVFESLLQSAFYADYQFRGQEICVQRAGKW